MVDAVAKPYLLEVLLEGLEVLTVAVALVIGVDFFEDGAQLQVGGVVLVPEDVAAVDGGLGEVVYERLLSGCQLLKVGDFVA